MLVTEDGNQYMENVTIDTSNNAIVHDVSQHGSVPESHVLIDFDLVSMWYKDNMSYCLMYAYRNRLGL